MFLKCRDTLWGSKDYNILRSILESPHFGKLSYIHIYINPINLIIQLGGHLQPNRGLGFRVASSFTSAISPDLLHVFYGNKLDLNAEA